MKRSFLSVLPVVLLLVLVTSCASNNGFDQSTQVPLPTATTELMSTNILTTEAQLVIDGKYLMVFHACDTATANCQDWQNHQVYLAQSDDSFKWSIIGSWEPYFGSVPDAIRRGETLYIYTPGEVVRYHFDTGVLDKPVPVKVIGAEGFVDPSVLIDDQGRLTLFFLYGRIGGDPAGCMPDQTTCENRFGSATEVEGSDGLEFAVDEGDRATVTISTAGPIRTASDPDIYFDGKEYILYIAYGPSISLWTSSDLRGTYTQSTVLPGGMLTNGTGGVAAGYFDPITQKYWTYAHVSNQNERVIIHVAVHDDLEDQLEAMVGYRSVASRLA